MTVAGTRHGFGEFFTPFPAISKDATFSGYFDANAKAKVPFDHPPLVGRVAQRIEKMRRTPRWILSPDHVTSSSLPEQASVPQCIAALLERRGFITDEARKEFLRPRLRSLRDPFLLQQMDAAVERILRAIDTAEQIVLYGDYDVDGVTSLALLNEMLRAYGATPALFLPLRVEEGYGLTRDGIERCWQVHRPALLIAVDCGTSSGAEIAEMSARGVDVIVLDHHEPKSDLPDCVAVVNPKAVAHCEFRYLSSVGIVFKLCHALLKTRPLPEFDLRRRLDLVALGTVADIVPLEGENRILVYHGTREIAERRLLGLGRLLDVAGVRSPVVSEHIGFRLGPRLNAAGRLTTAEKALQLLITGNDEEAAALASELDEQNRERQRLEREIAAAAEQKIAEANLHDAPAIVLGERGWHPGVLGIVASRIARRYHRPTIVVGFDEQGAGKGSGRSIQGLSLVATLAQCCNFLERFGGHEMAAGLTIREQSFSAFRARFMKACQTLLSPEQLEPRLYLEAELRLAEVDWNLLRWHELLQPFGQGNPQPVFVARGVECAATPQVLKEKHLALRLRQGGCFRRAIFFGGAEQPLPEPPWDVAFRIGADEYEGEIRIQMQVDELRTAGPIES